MLVDDPGFLHLALINAQGDEEIKKEFAVLSEPRRSILLWIFDLWIDIVNLKPKNKMTFASMSIVFSPNLVRADDQENPMIFLQYQKEAQRVLQDCGIMRAKGELNPTNEVRFCLPLFSLFLPHGALH